jgi:hypothetical protein
LTSSSACLTTYDDGDDDGDDDVHDDGNDDGDNDDVK